MSIQVNQSRENKAWETAEARRKILANWRGVDLSSLEKANQNKARSSGDLMPGVLKNLGLAKKRDDAEILKVWNHQVDPTIAKHAQPVGLRSGTLFVKVDSSVWLSEIVRFRRMEIIHQLQSSFGKEIIKKISFSLG